MASVRSSHNRPCGQNLCYSKKTLEEAHTLMRYFLSSSRWEAFRMNPSKQERFDRLSANAIQAMKLHGLRKQTIDSYCLTLRRVASFFERCPDNLTTDEFRAYFASLTDQYSAGVAIQERGVPLSGGQSVSRLPRQMV